MKLLNVRVSEDLAGLIEDAVKVSGSPTRSDWCREALQAGATRELAAYDAQQRRTRSDPASPTHHTHDPEIRGVQRHPQGQVERSGCIHPTTARWIGVLKETCTLCGATVRTRL